MRRQTSTDKWVAALSGRCEVAVISGHADTRKRNFHYADSFSWTFNGLALINSIGSGSTLPLMTIIFGSSIPQFNDFAVGGSSSSGFDSKVRGLVYVKPTEALEPAYTIADCGSSISF